MRDWTNARPKFKQVANAQVERKQLKVIGRLTCSKNFILLNIEIALKECLLQTSQSESEEQNFSSLEQFKGWLEKPAVTVVTKLNSVK